LKNKISSIYEGIIRLKIQFYKKSYIIGEEVKNHYKWGSLVADSHLIQKNNPKKYTCVETPIHLNRTKNEKS